MTSLEIEAFLATVKCGTLTKAAEFLHISQPCLSTRLNQLEAEMGCMLVVRRKGIKSVELTEKGRLFLGIAEQWNSMTVAAEDFRNNSDRAVRPKFRISSFDGPYLDVFPPVVKRFIAEHPDVDLVMEDSSTNTSYSAVLNGLIDMAFVGTNRHFSELRAVTVYSEKMVFVCNAGADYPPLVEVASLDSENCVYTAFSEDFDVWMASWFGARTPFITTNLNEQMCDLLVSSEQPLWSIVPASVAHRFVGTGKLSARLLDHNPPDRIIYCISKASGGSPYTGVFLNMLREELDRGAVSVTSML
ncbi:MAG: LysR family transcriptional regulator [Coriobacteriia bacterium]|nr:LysR family transcriptional regulator [Coriobacteriia bacterium]